MKWKVAAGDVMYVVKSVQEILNYLKADITNSEQNSKLIEEIEEQKNHCDQHLVSSGESSLFGALCVLIAWERGSVCKTGKPLTIGWGQIQHDQAITFDKIRQLNQILLDGDGDLRSTDRYAGDSEYLPVNHLAKALDEFEEILFSPSNPIRKAFEIYLRIVTIQPFENGNGRTGRLAADWLLMSFGYLPLCFDSPQHSQVAVTLNHPLRNKEKSFHNFLLTILVSYQILQPADS